MSVRNAIENLKMEMKEEGILPETGLGTDLFLFSSTFAPVINVDLLITNPRQLILLAWRNDSHSGMEWNGISQETASGLRRHWRKEYKRLLWQKSGRTFNTIRNQLRCLKYF